MVDMNDYTQIIKNSFQEDNVEESLNLGIRLAFGIGILNACTYVNRGKVFASSQGGNLLYMGLDFAKGDFSKFPKYLFPVILFGLGIFLAEYIHGRFEKKGWRAISIILEIILITAATFMPLSWNVIANPIFGMTCGLQGITFARFHKVPLATIYINGNIQNSIKYMTRFFRFRDEEDFTRTVLYIFMVCSYLLGIILGAVLSDWWHQYVSLLTVALLIWTLIQILYYQHKKTGC